MPWSPKNEWQVCEFKHTASLGLRLVVDMTHDNTVSELLKENQVPFVREEERGLPTFCIDPKAYDHVQDAIEKSPILRTVIGPLHPDWLRAVDLQHSNLYKRTLTAEKLDRLWNTVPARIRDQLKEYQREGVEAFWKHRDRFMICDEMGVGKTLQAITAMSSSSSRALCSDDNQYQEYPLLVAVPMKSVKDQWKREWQRWTGAPESDLCVIEDGEQAIAALTELLEFRGIKQAKAKLTEKEEEKDTSESKKGSRKRKKSDDANTKASKRKKTAVARIYLITYALLRTARIHTLLMKCKFPSIIMDETHKLKTHESKQSKMCIKLACASNVKRLLLLSGTPGSKAYEYYPPIRMVCPKLFPTYWKRYFCTSLDRRSSWTDSFSC